MLRAPASIYWAGGGAHWRMHVAALLLCVWQTQKVGAPWWALLLAELALTAFHHVRKVERRAAGSVSTCCSTALYLYACVMSVPARLCYVTTCVTVLACTSAPISIPRAVMLGLAVAALASLAATSTELSTESELSADWVQWVVWVVSVDQMAHTKYVKGTPEWMFHGACLCAAPALLQVVSHQASYNGVLLVVSMLAFLHTTFASDMRHLANDMRQDVPLLYAAICSVALGLCIPSYRPMHDILQVARFLTQDMKAQAPVIKLSPFK